MLKEYRAIAGMYSTSACNTRPEAMRLGASLLTSTEANKTGGGFYVEGRDVSEWRLSPAESDVLRLLRLLRSLPVHELSETIGVVFECVDNNYEKDTAILFHLIGAHGCAAVQDAVREMLGTDKLPTKDKQ
jgi:hypothetical protein